MPYAKTRMLENRNDLLSLRGLLNIQDQVSLVNLKLKKKDKILIQLMSM